MTTVQSPMPTNWDIEKEKIARNQQLAQMLMQQGMEAPQGQMVGKYYSAASPLSNLAGLAKGLLGMKMLERGDAQATDLTGRYNKSLSDALTQYSGLAQGKPEVTQPQTDELGTPTGGTQTVTPAVPGDKRAAINALLGSNHPLAQQLGMSMLTKLDEPVTLKEGEKVFVGGKEAYGNPKQQDQWSEPFGYQGALAQRNLRTGEIRTAVSRPPVTNVTTKVESSALTEGNKDFIQNAYRPTMDAARAAKQANADLDVLDKLPIAEKTGWGTQAKANAANVLQSLGIAGEESKKLAGDAQVFNSILNRQVWGLLGQQKGPQTEGDAQRARDTFAQLGNTPRANDFIKDLARATNNLTIKRADYFSQAMPKARREGDLTRVEGDWGQQAPSIWDDPVMQKWKGGGKVAPAGSASPNGIKFLGFE